MAGVAKRAVGRQGVSSASAAYERAAQLTADPARRARLLAAAAINAAEAGQFQRTAALADRINALALDPATLADFARVRSIVELDYGSPRQATRILLECVDRIGSGPDLLPLLSYAVHIVPSTGDRALMAEVWSRLPDEPRYATMRALTGPLDGAAAASAHRYPAPDAGFAERILAGALAQFVADHRAAFAIAAACVADCRTQDVVGWLHSSLYLLGEAQLAMGLYEDAAASAAEGLTVAEHDGRDHRATYLRATLATVAALTGAGERCRSLAATVLDHADRHGVEVAAAHAHRALGVLELGLGQADSALEHLEAARRRVDHPLPAAFFLPDFIEAAVRARRHDRLDEPVAQLTRWAAAAGTAASAALARRCQALTASDDEAEEHFRAAIDLHAGDADAQPFEQARTQLLYGEWLRRARRRSDARRQLRDALETFDRLGAAPWSHRAGTELKATGGSAAEPGEPDTGLLSRLSPQEREVVRLAATGATNREIAAQLFLSPRTVGHHLYRAYPKLGITSRTELSQVVD
ncbi:MAG: helix-turn-helix transcriptional regulator [Catenulispora sp.]|nr:helix-turn-helix transcriptional regulator [Catenulispora sp.]